MLAEGGLAMLPVGLALLALGGSRDCRRSRRLVGNLRQVDYEEYIVDPSSRPEENSPRNESISSRTSSRPKKSSATKPEENRTVIQPGSMKSCGPMGTRMLSTAQYKEQAQALQKEQSAAEAVANAPVETITTQIQQTEAAEQAKKDAAEALETERTTKLSYLSSIADPLQQELNAMSGWQKFWSNRDEEIVAQLNTLDSLIEQAKKATTIEDVTSISYDAAAVIEAYRASLKKSQQNVERDRPERAAYGADFVTRGPKLLLVGDNPGGRERVRVEPIGTPNRYGPGQESVVIQILGDVYGIEDLYQNSRPQARTHEVRAGHDGAFALIRRIVVSWPSRKIAAGPR